MIPIYRAKKIDSDEWVEGYYIPENPDRNSTIVSIEKVGEEIIDGYVAWEEHGEINYTVDQNTLAIHFQNMTDKNGKKIFASLSEDGVGGDEYKTIGVSSYIVYFKNGSVCGGVSYNECISLGWEADFDEDDYGNGETRCNSVNFVEVVGIHKGKTNAK